MIVSRCLLAIACCALPQLAPCAASQVFVATLSGANESPPNASTASGTAVVVFRNDNGSMHVTTAFSGLSTGTTAAHIHCCLVPPATNVGVTTMVPYFTGFPTGVTAGTYDHTFDMGDPASWNATFVTAYTNVIGAWFALLNGADSGAAYFNIHTTSYPGGEIRGTLTLDTLFNDGFE